MMPIGPLMKEHRLIERMVKVIKKALKQFNKKEAADPELVGEIIDFFRIYADRTHHGKEEDILFRDLKKKDLSEEHRKIMERLLREHVIARENIKDLANAEERYVKGEKPVLADICGCLEKLIKLYPQHIEIEDKHFFLPVMEYFSETELQNMVEESLEFDQRMIHEKYEKMVRSAEKTFLSVK